jgi:hypothetical protein
VSVTVKVVSLTFLSPDILVALGAGAFFGPSLSGSIDCRSANPSMRLKKYDASWAFGPYAP